MASAAPARKPPESTDGHSRPALMAQLGISDWTNVPNKNLEHWMDSRELPDWFRVLACIVRHSLGYQSDRCIRLERGQKRPFKQVDIARRLEMREPHVSRAMAVLERNGSVRTHGQTIFFCHEPRPQTEAINRPAAEEFSPLHRQLRAIRAVFNHALRKLAESGKFETLNLADCGNFSGPKVADSDRLSLLPESSESSGESGWVGSLLTVILEELRKPTEALTHTPAGDFKTLEALQKALAEKDQRIEQLEAELAQRNITQPTAKEERELLEYLRLFERAIGKGHPPTKIVRAVHDRLRGVPVAHFKMLVDRRASDQNFHLTSWGLFLNLADDAFEHRDFFADQDRDQQRAAMRSQIRDDSATARQFCEWCDSQGVDPIEASNAVLDRFISEQPEEVPA